MERPFIAHRGNTPHIFVSYAHKDAATVFGDMLYLHEQGTSIWYDEGIEPGADWRDELASAIADCKLFLFFASNQSVNSPNCRQEINFALNRNRPILLVYLEPVELPTAMEFSLSDRQGIERTNYSQQDYLARLLSAVTEPANLGLRIEDRQEKPSNRSIAVLPLLTIGADDDYLGEGIAAELVTGLTKVKDLDVTPRATSFAQASARDDLMAVARKLGVKHVLDGTLRRSGNKLRVTTDLFDAETGRGLWSEKYDRTFNDIFDVQEDIANAVISALKSEFGLGLGKQVMDIGTKNPSAYQAYLMACHERFKYTPESILETKQFLRRALDADPDFLDAILLLITTIETGEMLYGQQSDGEVEQLEEKAKQVDSDERVNWFWKERSRTKGSNTFSDPKEDEVLYREMIFHADHPASTGTNPNRWFLAGFDVDDIKEPYYKAVACYGFLLAQAGLYKQADIFLEQGASLSFGRACIYSAMGQFEKEEAFLTLYSQSNPDVVQGKFGQVSVLYQLGRMDEALSASDNLMLLANDDMQVVLRLQKAFWLKDEVALQAEGRKIETLELPLFIKALANLFVDVESAVERFEHAFETREVLIKSSRLLIPYYLPNSVCQQLEEHPRFIAIMDKLGIGKAWQIELSARAQALTHRLGMK